MQTTDADMRQWYKALAFLSVFSAVLVGGVVAINETTEWERSPNLVELKQGNATQITANN